jgi:protein-S-isoprenylcysteine O-methyltransferase Ste14
MTLWELELVPWYVFLAYWAFSALRVKQTRVEGSAAERVAHISIMVLACLFMFSHSLRVGPLQARFVPESDLVAELGILLTSVGVAIAIWARYFLGQYWSSTVVLKVDHQLIRSGPYAYVRHPIYSGLILALVGTALAVGEWRAVVGLALAIIGWSRKAATEETLLAGEFGDQYQEYRRHSGFLVPHFW